MPFFLRPHSSVISATFVRVRARHIERHARSCASALQGIAQAEPLLRGVEAGADILAILALHGSAIIG